MIRLVRWLLLGAGALALAVSAVVCLPLLIVGAVVDLFTLRRRHVPDPVDAQWATAPKEIDEWERWT